MSSGSKLVAVLLLVILCASVAFAGSWGSPSKPRDESKEQQNNTDKPSEQAPSPPAGWHVGERDESGNGSGQQPSQPSQPTNPPAQPSQPSNPPAQPPSQPTNPPTQQPTQPDEPPAGWRVGERGEDGNGSGQQPGPPANPPAQPSQPGESVRQPDIRNCRCSDIRATVVRANRFEFPRARLDLRVTVSSNSQVLNLAGGYRTITAENYLYRNDRGQVDPGDNRNSESVIAYYLLPGDEIHAKLVDGASLGGSFDWYIYGISRMGRESMPPRNVTVQDNLQIALEADRGTYNIGDQVRITLTITNVGKSDKAMNFNSGQRYDLYVVQNGREVWRWSQGRMFTQALGSLTLKPGESKQFVEMWSQGRGGVGGASPGDYTITGVITVSGFRQPRSGPITIRMAK